MFSLLIFFSVMTHHFLFLLSLNPPCLALITLHLYLLYLFFPLKLFFYSFLLVTTYHHPMITKSKHGIYEPKAYKTTIDYTITKSPLFSVLGHM